MSSIGYDFLTFDRPMILLNTRRRDLKSDKGLTLHRCGTSLLPEELESIEPKFEDGKSALRKELYRYTFADISDWHKKVEEIFLRAYFVTKKEAQRM